MKNKKWEENPLADSLRKGRETEQRHTLRIAARVAAVVVVLVIALLVVAVIWAIPMVTYLLENLHW